MRSHLFIIHWLNEDRYTGKATGDRADAGTAILNCHQFRSMDLTLPMNSSETWAGIRRRLSLMRQAHSGIFLFLPLLRVAFCNSPLFVLACCALSRSRSGGASLATFCLARTFRFGEPPKGETKACPKRVKVEGWCKSKALVATTNRVTNAT